MAAGTGPMSQQVFCLFVWVFLGIASVLIKKKKKKKKKKFFFFFFGFF